MFSLFLVQSKNSECLEGLDPGQTHPCFLKCLYSKSSRLDNCNDIEAETLCFEHFLALRLLHLWPLSSELPPFYLLAKTVNLNICTLRPQVILFNVRQKQCTWCKWCKQSFSHVSDAPSFCPSTFLSAPAKCKNRARASTSSTTIQRACTYTCFLSLTLARPFLQWNAALPWGQSNQISLTESTAVVELLDSWLV